MFNRNIHNNTVELHKQMCISSTDFADVEFNPEGKRSTNIVENQVNSCPDLDVTTEPMN